MLFLRVLQIGALVAAFARQILLRVVQFILVERKLRVRQFQAVRGSGVIWGRGFLGELRDVLLARGYARFEIRDVRRLVVERTAGGGRDGGGLPDGGGEILIDFLAGQARRFLDKFPLGTRVGERGELARRFERLLVYFRYAGHRRRFLRDARGAGIASDEPYHDRSAQQSRQADGREVVEPRLHGTISDDTGGLCGTAPSTSLKKPRKESRKARPRGRPLLRSSSKRCRKTSTRSTSPSRERGMPYFSVSSLRYSANPVCVSLKIRFARALSGRVS